MTPRAHLAALCAVAVLGALTTAAGPVEPGHELWVRVWHNNQLQTDGAVWATSVEGGSKGVLQPGNYFSLSNVGTTTPFGVKTSLTTSHPFYGEATFDLYLNANPLTSVDVVYNDAGPAEYFSNDVLTQPDPAPGDGPQVNDLCANAISVAVPSTTAGSTIGSTNDAAPFCGTSQTTGGVWYTLTGTGNQITVTTCNTFTTYDSKISIWCNSCSLTNCIGGNDDNCVVGGSFLSSTVIFCSQLGATYKVLVHGFGSATGNFVLNVLGGPACVGAVQCVAPAPTGACCFTDGSCQILTEAACNSGGGTYQGNGSACFAAGGTSTVNGAGGAIPDFGLGTFSNTIPNGPAITVADVDVNLAVNHTWTGDLLVTLTHNATSVVIIDRPGVPASAFGCSLDNWSNISLDDEGGANIELQCATNLVGNFTPAQALSAFDGMSAAGAWTLAIQDLAGADVGSVVSWSLDISAPGDPICPPPECFLVIGDGEGTSPFVFNDHQFTTQVGPSIEADFPVLMESYPSFLMPAGPVRNGNTTMQLGGQGGIDLNADVAEWMQDGEFSLQVLMWNPGVFPALPEQYTAGLHVQILPNGRVLTQPFGDDLGGMTVWHDIEVKADGRSYISFPFLVPNL